ncbi:MAG: 16S rRNA (guanine(527)-N(7))-methyltransferase RsmG [Sporichthyaceae bacterium]
MGTGNEETLAVPSPPPSVRGAFGALADGLEAYAAILASDGVVRGLIGPHEVPRLWDRHILNCAVLAEGIPSGARVADVGSGAGLPGLVLALVRSDLQVVLVESLLRRTDFLTEVVGRLGLTNVAVRRGRAEECVDIRGGFDVVVARAVAPLARLVPSTLPLLRPGGVLLAMKGDTAQDEIAAAASILKKARVSDVVVRRFEAPYVEHAATAVQIRSNVSRETGK